MLAHSRNRPDCRGDTLCMAALMNVRFFPGDGFDSLQGNADPRVSASFDQTYNDLDAHFGSDNTCQEKTERNCSEDPPPCFSLETATLG